MLYIFGIESWGLDFAVLFEGKNNFFLELVQLHFTFQ